jgi:hypothetical protein
VKLLLQEVQDLRHLQETDQLGIPGLRLRGTLNYFQEFCAKKISAVYALILASPAGFEPALSP